MTKVVRPVVTSGWAGLPRAAGEMRCGEGGDGDRLGGERGVPLK